MATTCGNPYAIAELRFTFVVEVDGVEQLRRSHHWRPREGTVEVVDAEGTVLLEQIHPYIASASPKEDALRAYKAFVNDSYWLLAPCKVLDEGVERDLDEGRLALSFEEVGLTPGDRYWLTVGERGEVRAWSYVLEDGTEGSFAWSEAERYGPLLLSTRRVASEGDVVVRFEEVFAR